MNRAVRWVGVFALGSLLVACETTGDPRQGGLFGWSEAKAKERQKERQTQVDSAQSELAGVNAQSKKLETRETGVESQLAGVHAENERATAKLRALEMSLVAKTDQLESESPTSAGASRARSWRLKVTTVAAQTALPASERITRLHTLEAQIDAALAEVRR